MRFRIGNIEIVKDEDVLVVAEIGINHRGSLEAAKRR